MQRNFATPISIPSIAVGTLSGQQYRWVAASDWNEIQTAYFADQRMCRQAEFIKFPKIIRKKQQNQKPQLGQWLLILRNSTETAIAWAEAQLYPSGFPSCQLYIGGQANAVLMDGISMLISAIFAGCDCDLINLWDIGSKLDVTKLEIKDYGTLQQVYVFDDHCEQPITSTVLQLSGGTWKDSATFKKYSSSLQSLSRKKQRADVEMRPKPRKRSLISRILSPWT